MSKILNATCVAGVVSVGVPPVPVLGVEILSEGVGLSQGVVLLEEDEATYIPKTTPDLKTTLEKISSALGTLSSSLSQIATTLTSIGAGMTGPTTAPPPGLAADVTAITGFATTLTALQAEVTVFKEVLK